MYHEVDYRKGYVHEPGYYRNLDSLKKIEKSIIGNIPIVKVKVEDIESFLEDMKDYSNSVLGKTYWQLKLAYREAVAAKIVDKNLMENREFRRPKSNKQDHKIHAFTLEEQKTALETEIKRAKQQITPLMKTLTSQSVDDVLRAAAVIEQARNTHAHDHAHDSGVSVEDTVMRALDAQAQQRRGRSSSPSYDR